MDYSFFSGDQYAKCFNKINRTEIKDPVKGSIRTLRHCMSIRNELNNEFYCPNFKSSTLHLLTCFIAGLFKGKGNK